MSAETRYCPERWSGRACIRERGHHGEHWWEPLCSSCGDIAIRGGSCANPFHVTGDPAWDSANLTRPAPSPQAEAAPTRCECGHPEEQHARGKRCLHLDVSYDPGESVATDPCAAQCMQFRPAPPAAVEPRCAECDELLVRHSPIGSPFCGNRECKVFGAYVYPRAAAEPGATPTSITRKLESLAHDFDNYPDRPAEDGHTPSWTPDEHTRAEWQENARTLRIAAASLRALPSAPRALREAAQVYAKRGHTMWCGTHNGIPQPCDCGLDALRRALASSPDSTGT